MLSSTRGLVALTAVLAVVFALSGWLTLGFVPERLPGELVLIAANTLPLLAIRRNPLAVVVILNITYPTWVELGYALHELQSLPAFTAMYALGAWDRPLWVRAVGLVTPVWLVAGGTLRWDGDPLELGYVGIMFAVVWGLGVVVAGRRSYAQALEARTAELEQARQELADRAVADERARIARELHDVVAHAMSVITVQAGVGGHLVDRRPAQAAESLRIIERTGREALAEMRRMLTVLREPEADHGDGRGGEAAAPLPDPQPRLSDLPRLVRQAADAGVRVSYTSRGPVRALPPGLELAAYRVAQEALTNMAKHAPGCRGALTVTYLPDALQVEVANGLPSQRPAEPVAPGQGLRGMAERVALYGGGLETVVDDLSFHVTASFPIEDDEVEA